MTCHRAKKGRLAGLYYITILWDIYSETISGIPNDDTGVNYRPLLPAPISFDP